jgi:hypothetical protein
VREDIMSCSEWVDGPFGVGANRAQTCQTERTVLVVVHHMTAATRLADVVPLLESDRRVQVVFTWAPASVSPGWVEEYLQRQGAMVVPWHQATQTRFDLAVTASYGQLERICAPVLTLPHGVGFNKYAVRWQGPGPETPREMYGAERAVLVYRGRVIPSAVVVPTERDRARLARACPEAAPVTVVAGDPCYDRLAASLPLRDAYRRALDACGRKIVVVSSTWGPGSLWERCPDVLPTLTRELPGEDYLVVGLVHPNVWSWHSRRQVRAWLADSIRRGLILIPPEEDWRGIVAAADVVIGDAGSVSCYSAAIGRPVLLASFPQEEIDPASAAAALGRAAPQLRADRPILPHVREAASACASEAQREIRRWVTDAPGQSARIIRAVMYKLMMLPEPADPPDVGPVPAPTIVPATFRAG